LDLPGYTVESEIDRGAFSVVYRAKTHALGRLVAVKALRGVFQPNSPFLSQFEREARALGALAHPNVVMMHDALRIKNERFLVLEYVEGTSLARLLDQMPRLPLPMAVTVAADIARGLAHVHSRGFVHRDIKPGNVLVSTQGEVKLVDFGMARPMGEAPAPNTSEDGVFGTPAYMAPEQLLGESADPRSDLFSLGVVLYQCLAGVRPFEGRGEAERRPEGQRRRLDVPVPVGRHVPRIPRALERLVMALLERNPHDRPGSALRVAERLDTMVRELKIVAPRSVVRAGLREAGFDAPEGEPEPTVGVDQDVLQDARAAWLRLAPFVAILGVILLGAVGIRLSETGAQDAPGAGDKALELLPDEGGKLQVLATPWAEVTIDGRVVDTTPFARPVPLSPGRHFVLFKHPSAPDESREIIVTPGETITLDVTMAVDGETEAATKTNDKP
jgi:serine/threonine-protein kinase